MWTPQLRACSLQHTGLHPLPSRAATSSEVDKVRQEADQLGMEDQSRTLLNKALDLCSKANAQAVLDAAAIARLQAVKPSTTDRRQIKGGLILHTSVLARLYKKCENDDRHKKELAAMKRLSKQQKKFKSYPVNSKGKVRCQTRLRPNRKLPEEEEDNMDCDEVNEQEENAISEDMGPGTTHPQQAACKKVSYKASASSDYEQDSD
ncbi:hypothetical protein HOY82DRAFT_615005 [Tuber indicum]|nr:hypothetical protein HOY82DRAFT_615005 [Tuber indicum]